MNLNISFSGLLLLAAVFAAGAILGKKHTMHKLQVQTPQTSADCTLSLKDNLDVSLEKAHEFWKQKLQLSPELEDKLGQTMLTISTAN